jgi:cytochrome b
MEQQGRQGIVWDLPVRLFHWLIVACFATSWLTREPMLIDVHAAAGYLLLALVAFRILWGFLGTPHARFSNFAYSPRATIAYVANAFRGRAPYFEGHNPAGSWSVYMMLAVMAGTAIAGTVTLAAMFALGPLDALVAWEWADASRDVHELLAYSLLVLVVLHLVGVLWSSRVHGEALTSAMVTGFKRHSDGTGIITPPRRGVGLAMAAAAATGILGYLTLVGFFDGYAAARMSAQPAKSRGASVWSRECDSCHFAYPANYLPPQANEALLADSGDHFGEDLGLSAGRMDELRRHARAFGDPNSWATSRLQRTAPRGAPSLRVTQSTFWKRAHEALVPQFAVRGSTRPHECDSCHVDAASGMFRPRLIHIPEQGSK